MTRLDKSASSQEKSTSRKRPSDYPAFDFWGRHFLASYKNCNFERLCSPNLLDVMHEAIEASGAELISETVHVFPNGGMTAVFLLAESHASLHTYPEHSSCFVDLFTCGDRCTSEGFDAILKDFLQPQQTHVRVLIRHESSEDAPVRTESC